MSTPCWGEGGFYGYFLLGKLVSGLLPRWGREDGLHEYSHWGEGGFYGYVPALGKSVSGLLFARGESGLHVYSLLGKRVGCMVISSFLWSEVL